MFYLKLFALGRERKSGKKQDIEKNKNIKKERKEKGMKEVTEKEKKKGKILVLQ